MGRPRKKKREGKHLRKTLSEKRRRHQNLGQNDKRKSPKSKTVGKGCTPNKQKEKVSTSSCMLNVGRGKSLSICEGKQFSYKDVSNPQITSTFDTSPSMNTRIRRQMTTSSNSKEKAICSDLNQGSRNLRTPSKLSGIHNYKTPLKSKEKNRPQDSTRQSPRISNIEIKSYKVSELGKMNCWTKGISPKDTKRCLQSGIELEKVMSSEPEIPKKQSLKRKSNQEETFIRRKKLRSEVKGDELWEGLLPVRFKRLSPKKPVNTQSENSSHANKISDKPQGNSSTYPNTSRRSFEDLYIEFLAKCENMYNNEILKNVKGSLSNTCFSVNKGISKCKLSSKSTSDIINCNTGEAAKNLREVFSKFKEESEIMKNTKLSEEDKNLNSVYKDKKEMKTDETCDISNAIRTNDGSVVTPKRSARLQEKRSSGKGRLFVSEILSPRYSREPCSQNKNSAARCLLPEYTNSKSDSPEKPATSNKYPKKANQEVRFGKPTEVNKNRSTNRSADMDKKRDTQRAERAETGPGNQMYQTQEKQSGGNLHLQSGQTPCGLDTLRAPTRDDHKHKSPGRPSKLLGRPRKSPGRQSKSPGRPSKSPGRQSESPGRSSKSLGRPRKSPGRQSESPGRPRKSPGRPSKSPGRPSKSPGRPSKSPGRPRNSPGRQSESPGRSSKSPGKPSKSPGRPSKSPGRPSKSPGRQSESPGRPSKSPGRPRNSQGRQSESPGRPSKSPGRQSKSPGRPSRSTGRPRRNNTENEDTVGKTTNDRKNSIHIIQEKEMLKYITYHDAVDECQPDIDFVKRSEERVTMIQNNCEKNEHSYHTDDNQLSKENSEKTIIKANENGDKIKLTTENQATECSNNATSTLLENIVENKATLLPNAQECSDTPQSETEERETDEMHTRSGDQSAACELAMSSSNIVAKQDVLSSDSKEILDVITDIINGIITKVEELEKPSEPKALPRAASKKEIDISCQMMVTKNPDKITSVHHAVGGHPLFSKMVDKRAQSDLHPESAPRDEAKLGTSLIKHNLKTLLKSKKANDLTDTRKPLKIVMKKTHRGAKIVKKLSELKAYPTVDLTRLSASCSLENPSTSNTLTVKIKTEAEKSPKSTPHDVMKQAKNTRIGSQHEGKKHTRSRTRSGDGEVTIALDNPDTELKAPRNKGKVHPPRVKSSSPKGKKKTPKRSQKCLTPSTPTRGLSADLTLLQNQTIGKHAIILWSSDNRRHFQLTHPDLDAAGVEEVMRNAWGDLNTKEKLKYFQRAYSATKDYKLKKDDANLSTALRSFLSLNPSKQYEQLQRRLEFVFSVSSEAYAKLMGEFKTELKKITDKTTKTDMQALYRKLLFQSILDIWDVILHMAQQKRDSQREAIRKEFNELTRKLIVGESVDFSKDVRSEKLAALLLDLNDLENGGKVSVSGEFIACSEYEVVLDDLLECEFEMEEWPPQRDLPQVHPQVFADVFSKALQRKAIPDLGASCLASDEELSTERLEYIACEFDQKVFDTYNNYQNGNIQTCCGLNSPACYLNNWLVADQFRLLSKTPVVDEHALIHPKLLLPVLLPLKQGKKQTRQLPSQADKCVNFNNDHRNDYSQSVPKPYIHPYVVTLSRSENAISPKSEAE